MSTVAEVREENEKLARENARLKDRNKKAEAESDEFVDGMLRGFSTTVGDYGGAWVAGRFVVERKIPRTPIPIAVIPGAIGTISDLTGLSNWSKIVDGAASFMTMQLKAETVVLGLRRREKKAATP